MSPPVCVHTLLLSVLCSWCTPCQHSKNCAADTSYTVIIAITGMSTSRHTETHLAKHGAQTPLPFLHGVWVPGLCPKVTSEFQTISLYTSYNTTSFEWVSLSNDQWPLYHNYADGENLPLATTQQGGASHEILCQVTSAFLLYTVGKREKVPG